MMILLIMNNPSDRFYLKFCRNDVELKLRNIIDIDLTKSRNIFFLETSHINLFEDVSLNNRQACSIESAALINPNAQISVVFVTNSKLNITESVKRLIKLKNVAFYRLDLLEFSLGTPVEAWIKSKIIYDHKYLTETISDLLRLMILWR